MFPEKNGRLTRWSLTLQPYTFEIQRKGKDNANADALSRLPENENNHLCLALKKEGRNVTEYPKSTTSGSDNVEGYAIEDAPGSMRCVCRSGRSEKTESDQ